MKYYLVNYIILDNRTVIENEHVGLSVHSFANIDEFKKSIAEMKHDAVAVDNIVIKSYKQISAETFNALNRETV
jgi:hypothetical protein